MVPLIRIALSNFPAFSCVCFLCFGGAFFDKDVIHYDRLCSGGGDDDDD